MSLKMKELMSETLESKSTILYYLKEDLLPEPSKLKPNVHLYDDSCVQIIRFIKYLQQNFSYSISDIKTIFKDNQFDFDASFDTIISSLNLISGSKNRNVYTKNEFLKLISISDVELEIYQEKGYIFERAEGYTDKEVEVAHILSEATLLGLDLKIADAYVQSAKELAIVENDIGKTLLAENKDRDNKNYELLFDLILRLKPYIFNMHTVKEHHTNIKKDI